MTRTRKQVKETRKPVKIKGFDKYIFLATLLLVAIGIVMVFSASYVNASQRYGDPYHFLKKNIFFAVLGTIVMIFMSFFSYKKIEKLRWTIAGTAAVLLVIVLTPLGTSFNGAQRWILIGPLTIMPSEIAKFASIILIAKYIKPKLIQKSLLGALNPIMIAGFFFAMIVLQPNLSTAGSIIITSVCMLFAAGLQFKYVIGTVAAGLSAGGLLAFISPYRWKRVTSFMDPFKDELGNGYQVIQSLYALGTGGLFGLGLGRSNEKFLYIPEPQNDFIFAIIGEELGYIGCIIILMVYVFLIYRCIKVAMNAPDFFSCMLVTGIASQIGVQVLLNVAVVTSSMPPTGIPLPFISYGGTSLVILMAAVGMVLNVSRYSRANEAKTRQDKQDGIGAE
ncbi:MAG: putative lipid II flippase FtsW [Peptoclostridium sp.]|uniref:putative lipid II flippase FtsW n=1 Tax=Peptoclostridium sp. TaxID=1904860 RepID=UPI00139C98AC|nr:putative lipid II flippase FtsW [Peptoclostridium sp.]MZQ76065.1 putative lipid II flippase FtsW [Peptoclostridium sp.]